MSALLMKKHNIVDVAELIQDSTPFNLKCNNTEDLLFLEEVKSYLIAIPIPIMLMFIYMILMGMSVVNV